MIDVHSAAGRRFEAGGVRSFVREQGEGPNVVLLHGVPASSFLYRKVIPRLADQGLRAIAFDFPGLGLADRPAGFDYSLVGPFALARRGDRRARARPLPSRRPRHRRADRLRVGDPQPRPGALADGAQHDLTPGDVPPPLDDAAVRGPRPRRALAARHPAVGVRGAVSPPGARRPRRDVDRRDLRLPRAADADRPRPRLPADHARLRADRGEGPVPSHAASADRPYPAQVVWGERDPALGLDHLEGVKRVLGVDDADPAARPSTSSRRTRPARSRTRSPTRSPRSARDRPRREPAPPRSGRRARRSRARPPAAARRAARPTGRSRR